MNARRDVAGYDVQWCDFAVRQIPSEAIISKAGPSGSQILRDEERTWRCFRAMRVSRPRWLQPRVVGNADKVSSPLRLRLFHYLRFSSSSSTQTHLESYRETLRPLRLYRLPDSTSVSQALSSAICNSTRRNDPAFACRRGSSLVLTTRTFSWDVMFKIDSAGLRAFVVREQYSARILQRLREFDSRRCSYSS